MTGIDRAALDDAAGRALFQRLRPDPDWPDWDVAEGRVRDIHRDWGAQVVDAVLPLIADLLEAEADLRRARISEIVGRELTHDPASSCYIRVAARLVRSLSQDGGNPTC